MTTTTTDFRFGRTKLLLQPKYRFDSDDTSQESINRLAVVSSRLPITVSKADNGRIKVKPDSSDIVTALSPLLQNNRGMWIGWPGSIPDVLRDEHLNRTGELLGCTLKPVSLSRFALSEKAFGDYYLGFSDNVLWPLFHGYPDLCKTNSGHWYTYQEINRKFAHTLARITKQDDYVWVLDYHLMRLAKELGNLGVNRRTGFFLQIPFPAHNILKKSPWQMEIIKDMLGFEQIGFKTVRDRDNFLDCTERITGLSGRNRGKFSVISNEGHQTEAGIFSTDTEFFRAWEASHKQPRGTASESARV